MAPWTVADVTLSIQKQRVDVWVQHGAGLTWSCPKCSHTGSLYDHSDERTWRHLDGCMFLTYLHARIPRVQCPEHGVLQVRVPWAEPHSRFTLLFERLAVEVLRHSHVKGAAQLLRLSWDEVMLLMERAVARGQARETPKALPHQLGVDEKYTSCGVLTLVNDLSKRRLLHVLPGKKKEPLKEYFLSFPQEQREQVCAVALDMCDTFYAAVAATIPEAAPKIVYDRFHVMQHVTRAVNQVRKQESAQLLRRGDDRLKGSRFLWLYSEQNVPQEHKPWLDPLKADKLQTGRAWALKELLRTLWQCADRPQALAVFSRWYAWARRSRLEPMKALAQPLRSRLSNILTYLEHRLTNAVSEGLNGALSTLLRRKQRGLGRLADWAVSKVWVCFKVQSGEEPSWRKIHPARSGLGATTNHPYVLSGDRSWPFLRSSRRALLVFVHWSVSLLLSVSHMGVKEKSQNRDVAIEV